MKIKDIEVDKELYPYLVEYVSEIKPFTGALVGKDEAIKSLYATYEDPIVSNAVLLAPPGTGKTTLMKGMSYQDKNHVYFGNIAIPDLDPNKFYIIGNGYYSDGTNTYYCSPVSERNKDLSIISELFQITINIFC